MRITFLAKPFLICPGWGTNVDVGGSQASCNTGDILYIALHVACNGTNIEEARSGTQPMLLITFSVLCR